MKVFIAFLALVVLISGCGETSNDVSDSFTLTIKHWASSSGGYGASWYANATFKDGSLVSAEESNRLDEHTRPEGQDLHKKQNYNCKFDGFEWDCEVEECCVRNAGRYDPLEEYPWQCFDSIGDCPLDIKPNINLTIEEIRDKIDVGEFKPLREDGYCNRYETCYKITEN